MNALQAKQAGDELRRVVARGHGRAVCHDADVVDTPRYDQPSKVTPMYGTADSTSFVLL
jgi:hypothetical protein